MQTEDIKALMKLGVLNPRTDDELDMLLIWRFVDKDPVVWKRMLAMPTDPKYPSMITEGTWRKVVEAMTPAEKEELRDRINAKRAPKPA